mgnify:CR=1 FL=1
MHRFNVGVIGLGFIGNAHVEALRRLGNVNVIAVADSMDWKRKGDAICVPHSYENYKELIDNEELDAVHICTPNSTHFEIAMYAMQKGIAVMLEKPFTVSVDEARALCEYASNHKIIGAVNHSLRMNPMVMEMKGLAKNGSLGRRIFAIHGSYLQDWLLFDTDWSWRLDSKMSGKTRAFSDIGTHWIDMVENITGLKAVEVLAEFDTVYKQRKRPLGEVQTFSSSSGMKYKDFDVDTEDWCSVLFRFNNGAIGSANISQVTAGRKNQQVIAISGSDASLYWENERSNELWIGHRNEFNQVVVKDPSLVEPLARKVISYPGGHVEGFPDTLKQQFKLFYEALEKKSTERAEFALFKDGLREMIITDCVYRSAMERRWIEIKEDL